MATYRKNPENTNAGRAGSVYGQSEMENNTYSSSIPVHTTRGTTITVKAPVEAGMEKYDGIMKMVSDKPAVFDSDKVGRIRTKESNSL